MKTLIKKYEKNSNDDLREMLKGKDLSVTDKAAINSVLKARQTGKGGVDKPASKATPKAKATPAKKEKAAKKPKAPKVKKVGVIQTIFNTIEKGATTEAKILTVLSKAFPDKTPETMQNTIKAQIGSKKRPMRMEREKNVTFTIAESKKGIRTFSLPAKK